MNIWEHQKGGVLELIGYVKDFGTVVEVLNGPRPLKDGKERIEIRAPAENFRASAGFELVMSATHVDGWASVLDPTTSEPLLQDHDSSPPMCVARGVAVAAQETCDLSTGQQEAGRQPPEARRQQPGHIAAGTAACQGMPGGQDGETQHALPPTQSPAQPARSHEPVGSRPGPPCHGPDPGASRHGTRSDWCVRGRGLARCVGGV